MTAVPSVSGRHWSAGSPRSWTSGCFRSSGSPPSSAPCFRPRESGSATSSRAPSSSSSGCPPGGRRPPRRRRMPELAAWASGLEMAGLNDQTAAMARRYLSRLPELTPGARAELGERIVRGRQGTGQPAAAAGHAASRLPGAVLAERHRREHARLMAAAAPPPASAAPARAPPPGPVPPPAPGRARRRYRHPLARPGRLRRRRRSPAAPPTPGWAPPGPRRYRPRIGWRQPGKVRDHSPAARPGHPGGPAEAGEPAEPGEPASPPAVGTGFVPPQ